MLFSYISDIHCDIFGEKRVTCFVPSLISAPTAVVRLLKLTAGAQLSLQDHWLVVEKPSLAYVVYHNQSMDNLWIWLVVGIPTPLEKIRVKVNWDDDIPTTWKNGPKWIKMVQIIHQDTDGVFPWMGESLS